MKIIQKTDNIARMALGHQKRKEEAAFRFLTYCVAVRCDDGVLLHNVMTKEILLLEGKEAEVLAPEDLNASQVLCQTDTPLFAHLRENWYIVPQGHDDKALCLGLRAVARQLRETRNAGRLTSFSILSTTACNAKCFYCYERGARHEHMTRETALGVVDFIRRSCGGGKVSLNWFGGEPLFNTEPMDIITDGLAEAGIEFRSSMISNGYLFDDALVQRAKERWRLGSVQITLDGTEEVYNATKAYIYKDGGSPFRRVTDNIERLLRAGVKVIVRLHLDGKNCDDILALTDYIASRYVGYDGLSAYPGILFNGNKPIGGEVAAERLGEDMPRLWARLEELRLAKKRRVRKNVRTGCCMADLDSAVIVQTNGDLGKCQHYIASRPCGNINVGVRDKEEVDYWKRPGEDTASCMRCPLYPDCVRLAGCSSVHVRLCQKTLAVRADRVEKKRCAVLSQYDDHKREKSPTDKNVEL